MARTQIRNIALEGALTLPAPLRGVLALGDSVISSKTVSELEDLFNSSSQNSFVELQELGASETVTPGLEDAIDLDSLEVTTLAVTGAATVGTTLGVTGALAAAAAVTVGTTLGVTGDVTASAALSVGTDLTVTGNIVAAQRQSVGPFTEALAADQTATVIDYGAAAMGWVAPRAGSLTGLSSIITAAITGGGTQAVVSVAKNGTVFPSSPTNTLTQAGAEVKANATAAIGACTFVAGDVLTVIYTSTTITNTPSIVSTIEVTC